MSKYQRPIITPKHRAVAEHVAVDRGDFAEYAIAAGDDGAHFEADAALQDAAQRFA